jgi:hypothetical protein
MKLIYLMLIIVLISCSGQGDKSSGEIVEKSTFETDTNENKQKADTLEILDNGLMSKLKGDWITTILPDSILQTREILRWKNVFYGDLMISIHDNDTVIISGNMDWGPLKYEVVDEKTFILPEWNNTKVIYSPEKDLIYWGGTATGRVFERFPSNDFVEIISNEKLLMEYVINILFKDDYLPKGFASKIKYISLGLETYTPFTFDAIGIENQNKEIEYYGWKFIGDTLNLYKTSFTYDDDSGFISYKLEDIDRQYYKNN